ncbi:ATP-binding cassette domain-containing protein, partial [Staphylococcus kloosii]|uniref:ATP-binding cassette domain-containing protein n=1 Tax=Staphylococcus kloosii TaxID=29384 RepID=UPI0028A4DCB7
MEINDYSLKVKGNSLIEGSNLHFYESTINHIVGKNGVGKSQLAKDFLLNISGQITPEIQSNTTLISSSSNIPSDLSKEFLMKILKNKFDNHNKMFELSQMLNLEDIPNKIMIKNLSDGQKQKLKLFSFLMQDKNIIIFDEITNALDKTTINEIYSFINKFIAMHPSKVIINITHNLA